MTLINAWCNEKDMNLDVYKMFIIQTNKCTTSILLIFYTLQAVPHVSVHLHHLQGVLTLYFAKVTKLLKFNNFVTKIIII